MTRVVHLVVGPDRHGVVQHALTIAAACTHPVLRAHDPQSAAALDLSGWDVVHVPYTDRLFAPTCEDSAARFGALAQAVAGAGAMLSVTLHDVPAGDAELQRRRRAAYAIVTRHARGIVVNSRHELRSAAPLAENAHSLRVVPLPVVVADGPPADPSGRDVAVLGFVYPDRGYEHTIGELPPASRLLALGGPADGHEELPHQLAAEARRCGREWSMTGYLATAELGDALRTAAVPVAPNRRVSASGSIATWLGYGRRPLVPRAGYTEEIDAGWPGTVTIYDADEPGALRRAIEAALADPASTLLPTGAAAGPGLAEIASSYGAHLHSCAAPAPLPVGHGAFAVPGNRWDLLAGVHPVQPPRVSVVVPYYEAPRELDRALAALALQTHPHERLQVVVADDGSRQPPRLPADAPFDLRLVRQDDRGFRAAAARNLGAAASDGEVVLFLDGDTVPEPDYVARLSRLPAMVPDCVVVGRRRHADLSGWTVARLRDWLTGHANGPAALTEPRWLREAYAGSRNLLDADARSYRHMISAVLGMHRDLFGELDGFCEQFDSYGGEDWELAHRAYCAGAVFAHVPEAVAWHHGGDWALRTAASETGEAAAKNAETLMLARLLPDPQLRGPGQWLPYASIMVILCPDADDAAAVLFAARTAFVADADCGLWLAGPHGADISAALGDPRIRAGAVPPDVLARASVLVELDRAADLSELGALAALAMRYGEVSFPAGRARSARAVRRALRWAGKTPEPGGQGTGQARGALAELWFGRHDTLYPEPWRGTDLANCLGRLAQPQRRS